MNSLVNYGSDDDLDDSSDEKQVPASYGSSRGTRKHEDRQDDANYDEVQMSLSEESNDESKASPERRDLRHSPKSRDDYNRRDRSDRDKHRERSVERTDRDRYTRDDRDKYSSKYRDEGSKDKDRYRIERNDDKSSRDRRGKSKERYRDRKDRDRRRSRSPRERRSRSRSPRKSDRSRSRSRSRDRGNRGGFAKRFDRSSKFDRLDKMGIDIKKDEISNSQDDDSKPKDRFFVPGITGRFREQIEKRKLLWQKKEPVSQAQATPPQPKATKVWEATTFAQDTDGKVANKFKRLMGIKNVGEGSKPATEVLKKQEEMFSSMEQQYEVARTATHTMRGVGLGFGSYQR